MPSPELRNLFGAQGTGKRQVKNDQGAQTGPFIVPFHNCEGVPVVQSKSIREDSAG
jgi:hypothetical protein